MQRHWLLILNVISATAVFTSPDLVSPSRQVCHTRVRSGLSTMVQLGHYLNRCWPIVAYLQCVFVQNALPIKALVIKTTMYEDSSLKIVTNQTMSHAIFTERLYFAWYINKKWTNKYWWLSSMIDIKKKTMCQLK